MSTNGMMDINEVIDNVSDNVAEALNELTYSKVVPSHMPDTIEKLRAVVDMLDMVTTVQETIREFEEDGH